MTWRARLCSGCHQVRMTQSFNSVCESCGQQQKRTSRKYFQPGFVKNKGGETNEKQE
jgi:rRNA maturation endonuclease Nob1